MIRPLRALAGAAVVATAALPAAAASFFTFDVTATFTGVTIDGVEVNKPFRISGQSAPLSLALPWDGSAVDVQLVTSSVELSYDGGPGVGLSFKPFTFGILGEDVTPNDPATFRFTRTSGQIDFRPITPVDSLGFETLFGDVATWVGFGGGLINEPGPTGTGGRRFAITTTIDNGVVQFGVNDVLQSLTYAQNTRTATLVTAPATVIPLPAAGWLMLAALGGLGALRLAGARRPAAA